MIGGGFKTFNISNASSDVTRTDITTFNTTAAFALSEGLRGSEADSEVKAYLIKTETTEIV